MLNLLNKPLSILVFLADSDFCTFLLSQGTALALKLGKYTAVSFSRLIVVFLNFKNIL